jgi:hypothetical protein
MTMGEFVEGCLARQPRAEPPLRPGVEISKFNVGVRA